MSIGKPVDAMPANSRAGASRRRSSSRVRSPRAPTTSVTLDSGSPADTARAAEYNEGPYAGVAEQALKGLASLEPTHADVGAVAEAIVNVVELPFGKRPFRTHVDPSQDGCEIVNGVADRVRAEMFRRIGLEGLLSTVIDEAAYRGRDRRPMRLAAAYAAYAIPRTRLRSEMPNCVRGTRSDATSDTRLCRGATSLPCCA